MQRKLEPTLLNPISLLGAFIAIFAFVIIMVLLALGASGTIANPYTGILTFILGPGALVAGLIMIPIGAIRQRRRLAKLGIIAKTFPLLDLNDPRQRRGIAVFSAATAGILSLMAATTYGAAEYMETQEFCSALCHRVMDPEGAAYEASPHARVKCVSCHIGPGAPWLVKAKISGIRQVFNYTLDRYERPIAVPIQDLRPSRDTCEECHWPERFYGDKLRPYVHFAPDEQNTARSQPLVFRVGGSELGHGIHWHTTADVWYLPLDEARSEIGWVKVQRPDGSVDEYVLPDKRGEVTPERIQSDQRFMDCMDCHNRAAHNFVPIEAEIDKEMAEASISPAIPFIKQQAMKAVGDPGPQTTDEEYQAALKRIDGIADYYRSEHPDAYVKYQAQIKQAVAEVTSIYRRSVFPDMHIAPRTYPDWVGHDGCMRCHGRLEGISGDATGKMISSGCLNCHFPAPSVPSAPDGAWTAAGLAQLAAEPILPAAIPHPLDGRDKCSSCHTAGAPGVGAAGGTGIPDNHKDRTDATCVACHALAQSPVRAAAAPTKPAAPASPAASGGTGSTTQVSPAGPPAVPHPAQGRETCGACHTVGAPGVGAAGGTGIADSHKGRTDATCLSCHTAAQPSGQPIVAAPEHTATPTVAPTKPAEPTAIPTAAPTAPPSQPTTAPPPPATSSGPAAIPHPTQGRETCTMCHQPGGAGVGSKGGTGTPTNHQGRADATCVGCHQPA